MRDRHQVKKYDSFILRASGILPASMSVAKHAPLRLTLGD